MYPVTALLIFSFSIHSASGQVFTFTSPLTFTSKCGSTGHLSVDGAVTLSAEDLDNDHFLPTVYIQTDTEICTIDLSSCSYEASPNATDTCNCLMEGDTMFLLYIRKRINPSESGKMLQAALHHHDPNNPTVVLANIGRITPESVNTTQSGHTVFTLDDGTQLLCDVTTDGGNWIVFQHRSSAQVDFYRNWQNYTEGFGDINGNFWLGLDKVYQICKSTTCELRVDMKFNGKDYYATYRQFSVSDNSTFFKLHVAGYEGNAGDVFSSRGNGRAFTTKDQEHDGCHVNCADVYFGGWWYDCCHGANLNGVWGNTNYGKGLNWNPLTGYHRSVTYVEMKVRPLQSGYTGQIVVGK